jgi:hypothetical protein
MLVLYYNTATTPCAMLQPALFGSAVLNYAQDSEGSSAKYIYAGWLTACGFADALWLHLGFSVLICLFWAANAAVLMRGTSWCCDYFGLPMPPVLMCSTTQ